MNYYLKRMGIGSANENSLGSHLASSYHISTVGINHRFDPATTHHDHLKKSIWIKHDSQQHLCVNPCLLIINRTTDLEERKKCVTTVSFNALKCISYFVHLLRRFKLHMLHRKQMHTCLVNNYRTPFHWRNFQAKEELKMSSWVEVNKKGYMHSDDVCIVSILIPCYITCMPLVLKFIYCTHSSNIAELITAQIPQPIPQKWLSPLFY
jgi:hypothetical protein